MHRLALALPVILGLLAALYWLAERQAARRGTVTRIAFGSCNQAFSLYQPLWEPILKNRPDLWTWIGDAVYADTRDITQLRAHYAQQVQRPDYQQLLRDTPVIGVWDDHDYGEDNAGKDYPIKAESQQAFLDFIGEPAGSARRERAGIYTSHDYGPAHQRLKIILLDTRYHRDRPGPQADLLGEEQWRWLTAQLAEPETDLVLLVSSIVVLPRQTSENWLSFGAAAERLGTQLRQSRAPVVILSGDIHVAELSRASGPELAWPLYELTSSGMTHSASNSAGFANAFRVGALFTRLNFGLVTIDWGYRNIKVRLEIRDIDNKVQIAETASFPRTR